MKVVCAVCGVRLRPKPGATHPQIRPEMDVVRAHNHPKTHLPCRGEGHLGAVRELTEIEILTEQVDVAARRDEPPAKEVGWWQGRDFDQAHAGAVEQADWAQRQGWDLSAYGGEPSRFIFSAWAEEIGVPRPELHRWRASKGLD